MGKSAVDGVVTLYTSVNGYKWPAIDRDCRAVVFDSVADLRPALSHVKNRIAAVQAGGNCGVWPAALAKLFKAVWTCEPDPVNYECLKHNVPDNVVHIQAALGAEPARVGLKDYGNNIGAHYIDGPGDIPLVTIDSLELVACDFIALDVEGYELAAFRGAEDTLKRFRPVVQFEDKGLSARYGVLKGEAVDWLQERGYRVAAYVKRDVVMVPE